MNPFADHPEMKDEPITNLGAIGITKYSEGKSARKYIKEWLEDMRENDPEAWAQHLQYEKELREARNHNYHY